MNMQEATASTTPMNPPAPPADPIARTVQMAERAMPWVEKTCYALIVAAFVALPWCILYQEAM